MQTNEQRGGRPKSGVQAQQHHILDNGQVFGPLGPNGVNGQLLVHWTGCWYSANRQQLLESYEVEFSLQTILYENLKLTKFGA